MTVKFNSMNKTSKYQGSAKLIRAANKLIWKYDFDKKKYVNIKLKHVEYPRAIVEFTHRGENQLKDKDDVRDFVKIIKDVVCPKLDIKYRCEFVKLPKLLNSLLNKSLGDQVIVDNIDLVETIDQASAGGVLLAKSGTYEGKYYSYDINNSYNKFFVDYEFPTNPKFITVNRISNKALRLYRLDVDKEFKTKEWKDKFKTTRKWFTYFDVKAFNLFNIKYTLVEMENNCVEFESFDADFEWMEKLNELKQKAKEEKNELQSMVFKELLSSVWGRMCSYQIQPQFTEDEEIPPYYINPVRGELEEKYFYNVHPETGEDWFKNPNQIYKYACGIAKPFILAYARYRLLKQMHKIEKKGYEIVYCHTDSIVCNAKEKYFDIGCDIGQWKQDRSTKKGIEVKSTSFGGVKFF